METPHDRSVTVPLDRAISPTARLLLPTYRDDLASQDLMASAPRNPLFRRAIELNLARRRAGIGEGGRRTRQWRPSDLYYLGPPTFEHAIAHVVFGERSDAARVPPAALRAAVERAAARRPPRRATAHRDAARIAALPDGRCGRAGALWARMRHPVAAGARFQAESLCRGQHEPLEPSATPIPSLLPKEAFRLGRVGSYNYSCTNRSSGTRWSIPDGVWGIISGCRQLCVLLTI